MCLICRCVTVQKTKNADHDKRIEELAQLQSLVAAASEPALSEADEDDTMEKLHEDDAWSKVEPSEGSIRPTARAPRQEGQG